MTIDNRYPAFDDGLSWPALLTRYRCQREIGHYLLLRRRKKPEPFALGPIWKGRGRLGMPVKLPLLRGGPISAKIQMKSTLFGRLAGLLFRMPCVCMTLHRGAKLSHTYRFIPGEARTGFLLSPMINKTSEFAQLSQKRWKKLLAGEAVSSLMLTLNGPGIKYLCYGGVYKIALYRLRFAH